MDARKLSKEEQRQLRRTALSMRSKGWTMTAIASALDASYAFVQKTIARALADGTETAIAGGTRGRRMGEQRLLTSRQERRVKKLVISKTPNQLGFDFALWTRESVQQLIEQVCGVKLAIRTVGEYLARWGMTPQRPAKFSFQQNSEEVQQWLTVDYPKIEERAKKEGAQIFWQDETKMCQDSNVVRGYSPKGSAPVLVENKRAHYSSGTLCSAINNQGKTFFTIKEYDKGLGFNSSDFLDFLKGLLADQKQLTPPNKTVPKLFVICDNHRMHKTAAVRDWVKDHEREIELFYLPPYSPQLNPQEQLNQCVKDDLRRCARRSTKQIVERVTGVMNSLRKASEMVQRIFLAEPVRYAANAALCSAVGAAKQVSSLAFMQCFRLWCGVPRGRDLGLGFITI